PGAREGDKHADDGRGVAAVACIHVEDSGRTLRMAPAALFTPCVPRNRFSGDLVSRIWRAPERRARSVDGTASRVRAARAAEEHCAPPERVPRVDGGLQYAGAR